MPVNIKAIDQGPRNRFQRIKLETDANETTKVAYWTTWEFSEGNEEDRKEDLSKDLQSFWPDRRDGPISSSFPLLVGNPFIIRRQKVPLEMMILGLGYDGGHSRRLIDSFLIVAIVILVMRWWWRRVFNVLWWGAVFWGVYERTKWSRRVIDRGRINSHVLDKMEVGSLELGKSIGKKQDLGRQQLLLVSRLISQRKPQQEIRKREKYCSNILCVLLLCLRDSRLRVNRWNLDGAFFISTIKELTGTIQTILENDPKE